MQASNRWILPLAIGALVLQGCATTGGSTQPAATQVSAPAQTAAASVPVSKPSTTAIPENDGQPVVKADTKDNFDAVATAVRQQMQPGGRYAFVDKTGRETVEAKLGDMGTLFGQYGSVNKMDPAAQQQLLADQNAINEVLARYDSNRRICWHETPVGTLFPKTVCRTLGQIQSEHRDAQHNLDQAQKFIQQQNQIKYGPVGGGH